MHIVNRIYNAWKAQELYRITTLDEEEMTMGDNIDKQLLDKEAVLKEYKAYTDALLADCQGMCRERVARFAEEMYRLMEKKLSNV